jgi:hypothetical protein
MPICTKCRTEQPVLNFNKQKSRKVGHTAHCKACLKTSKAKYYQENKLQINKKQKEYNETNKDKNRKKVKLWKLKNPDKVKQYRLNKYGITLQNKEQMLQQQNGCCAICNKKIVGQINIDHCHTTGKVREILCNSCNFLLGNCKDKIDILENAIQYLGKHMAAKPGLYANIHAKQERIKAGSGEKMRKVGTAGAPTAKQFKESAKTAKVKK